MENKKLIDIYSEIKKECNDKGNETDNDDGNDVPSHA